MYRSKRRTPYLGYVAIVVVAVTMTGRYLGCGGPGRTTDPPGKNSSAPRTQAPNFPSPNSPESSTDHTVLRPSTAPGLSTPSKDRMEEGWYRVVRVVDGDTLLLEHGVRIRLLGVNTPETVAEDRPVEPFGPEASAFTKQFIGDHPVRLRFDKERRDQYDRWLAYVYVGDQLLNEELIRAGLSKAQLQYRYSDSFKRLFKSAQTEAQSSRLGLWSQTASR